jgi:hypothetical protein
MSTALLHFLLGTAGTLGISLVLARLAGEASFSAPFGALFVGILCGSTAHFLSPWATPAILVIYLLAGVNELVQDRKAREASVNPQNGPPCDTRN